MKKSKKLLHSLLRITLLAYVVGGISLYIFQRDLLFLPTTKVQHNFSVEQFKVEGATLDVVVVNPGKTAAVMYFGGNAESVVEAAPDFQRSFADMTVYLVNYRGYGGSTGQPTEHDLFADAQYVYQQIKPRHQQIALIGRSLGSGVATFLATKADIPRLVLVTPYDSIVQVAQARYPVYPISWMIKDPFESLSRVPQVKAQTLVLLAEQDVVVPHQHSHKLIQAFPAKQVMVQTVAHSQHNDITEQEQFFKLSYRFLREMNNNTTHLAHDGIVDTSNTH